MIGDAITKGDIILINSLIGIISANDNPIEIKTEALD